MLALRDTATGRVGEPRWREAGRAGLYVCGPTVYDRPHVGHARSVLVFDVLRRYLESQGRKVRHVSNVTDIDDKIIRRARDEGRSWKDVAAEAEEAWWEAVDALGALRPTVVPHATEFLDEMIEVIAALRSRGAAYETSDGVYFDVSALVGYGALAHQPLEQLRAGARVEVDEAKRSPMDFALWKAAKPGEPRFPSPFGEGRPGWHTECVAMSLALLGEGFDLHGGGQDLVFPHHENERAQAVALGRAFARHWVHHGMVTVGGEKMSKSLGNFTSVHELLERFEGRCYRLLVLQSHYRAPLEVGPDSLSQAAGALARVDALARRLRELGETDKVRAACDGEDGLEAVVETARRRFCEAMDDDLDTPGALAGALGLVRDANAALDARETARGAALGRAALELLGVLGVVPRGEPEEVDPEVARLVARREDARRGRDYAAADALRQELARRGYVVEDTPSGPRVYRSR
jgi:cysteinyl-tRNA synthetase